MAKPRLNLDRLNPDEVVGLGNMVKTAMTGNATYPSPNPTLTALGTLITTATNKIAAFNTIKAAMKTALEDRDVAVEALKAGLRSEASHVENVSNGDAVKIQSAGMSVRAAGAAIGPLGQVQNLSITAGDSEGRLDLQWDPVHGVKNYEIQCSTDPNVPANWKLVDTSGASHLSIEGLTSGAKLWYRVRAKAPKRANDGAWSDPATKVVP
jgi:hypothetical protein